MWKPPKREMYVMGNKAERLEYLKNYLASVMEM